MPYLPPSNDSDYILDIDSDQIEDSQDDSYENTADYTSYEYTGPSDIGVPDPDSSSETPDPIPTNETQYKVTYKDRRPLDSTEPLYLEELYNSGAKFYAIYDDDTEEEVSWTEIQDLDPLETEIDLSTAIASASNQHFWDDTNGVHVSEVAKEDWNDAVSDNFSDLSSSKNYYNILMNSLGLLLRRALYNLVSINRAAISFYDGLGNESSNIMASFGRNSAQIGRSAGKHITIDNNGIAAYDGANIAPLNASNITAAEASIQQLQANTADISTIRANSAKVQSLTAEALTAATAYIAALNTASVTANDISADKATIAALISGNVTTDTLRAASAYIAALNTTSVTANDISADKATIAALISGNVTTDTIRAASAYISSLVASNISASTLTADHASLGTVVADYLKSTDMEAERARVATLIADYATVANLNAAVGRISNLESTKADISLLESDYIDADTIEANYLKTDISNTTVGWIENGTIKNGAITNAMINSVSANKLTAGTIDASVINVTNLQADDISVTRINGQTVSGKTLVDALEQHEDDISDLDTKIDTQVEALNDRIDGAIETFTGTAVPTLSNSPASSWNTTKLKDQHVGDVYYVVNSSSQQNGYCYRFTKSGSSYSWQLIKDSDVTAALGRLQTAEGKISTIEQFDSDISSWKTDTDEEIASIKSNHTTLAGRVTTAEGELETKVDQTTFNTLEQTVGTNSSSITSLTTTTTQLRNDFDNIEIGVRNLLRGTADPHLNSEIVAGRVTIVDNGVMRLAPTSSAAYVASRSRYLDFSYFEAGEYTLSFDAKCADVETTYTNVSLGVFVGYSNSSTWNIAFGINANHIYKGIYEHSLTNDWQRFSVTINPLDTPHNGTLVPTDGCSLRVEFYASPSSIPVDIRLIKLEKGNRSTDWSPAPEDVERKPNILRGTNQLIELLPFNKREDAYWSDGLWAISSGTATNGDGEIVELDNGPDGQLYAFHVWSINSNNKDVVQREVPFIPNVEYQVSFYVRLTPDVEQSNIRACVRIYGYATESATSTSALRTGYSPYLTSTEWVFATYNFVLTDAMFENSNKAKSFLIGVNGKGDIQICGVKLEQSDYATKWAPSPFDSISVQNVNKVSNKVSEITQTIDGITTRIGSVETTLTTKADGSTVESISSDLNDISETVAGHTQTISSINSTLSTKADGSTVSTLSSQVNDISDTVNGHTSQLTSITQTQTSIQGNAVKSTVQLWFTKANTSAPSKPTAHITVNDATKANQWNLAVPNYNATYPNYYYCYEYQYLDGSYGWSAVTRDIATGEMQERARTAITNAANAQADIDGLSIGGRNLVTKAARSGLATDAERTYTRGGRLCSTNIIFENPSLISERVGDISIPYTEENTDGAEITISFECKLAEGGVSRALTVYGYQNTGLSIAGGLPTIIPTNEWQKYVGIGTVHRWTTGNGSTVHGSSYSPEKEGGTQYRTNGEIFIYDLAGTNYFIVRNVKIEKGNRATDWTPAPEDVDADISIAQTAADTAQATADKNVKESIQLWITKASSSAPAKPTSKVTSTAVSGNAWTTKVPTYNSTYPYYFYCMQYIAADGTVTWSDVVYDQATTEAQSVARTATTNLSTLQQDYATFKQTTQNFESTIGSTYATKTEVSAVQTNLDNLEIGGRNLIGHFNWSADTAAQGSAIYTCDADGTVTSNNIDNTTWSLANSQWQLTLEAGTYQFTIEVLHACDTWGSAALQVWNSSTNILSFTSAIFNNGGIETKSFTLSSTTDVGIKIKPGKNAVCRFKLEKGTKPTDWTPAPEDQTAYVDDYVNNSIDNLEIGGRNLLRNSSSISVASSGFKNVDVTVWGRENVVADDILTVSFDALTEDDGCWMDIYWRDSSTSYTGAAYFRQAFQLTNQLSHFEYSGEAKMVPTEYLRVRTNNSAYGPGVYHPVTIYNLKLEKGNKATDWTPAPEDVDFAIETAPKYKYVTSTYTIAYSTWLDWSTEGRTLNNFILATSDDYALLNVGDIACCKGTNSTDNKPIYILIEVTSKNGSLKISGIAHGLIDPQIRTTVNAIESRVTSAETSITQNNEAIALKANASDVYTKSQTDGLISTEVTNRNSAIEQSASAINLSVSQTYSTKTEATQMAQPNLAPLFSVDHSDVYNATTNPNGYWRTSLTTGGFTRLDNGWSHFEFDNTNGTALKYNYIRPDRVPDIVPGNPYTILLEIRNNNPTGTDTHDVYLQQIANNQFWGNVSGETISGDLVTTTTMVDLLTCGASFIRRSYRLADVSHITSDSGIVFTYAIRTAIGGTNSFDIRMSLYDGIYDGPYKPYSGLKLYATNTNLEAAKASIKVTTDGITTEVEKKTDKSSIISTINQSAETVKIQASKVEIDGTAIFNSISSSVDDAITDKGYATTSQAQGYATTAKNEAISAAASDATSKANTAKSEAISTAASDATSKANTAKSEAISAAASDATTKANAVQTNLDNLEIGGRNLLQYKVYNYANGSNAVGVASTYRGMYCAIIGGEKYTISRKVVEGNRFWIDWSEQEPASGVSLHAISRDNTALKVTVDIPSEANWLFIYLSNQGDEIHDGNIKVERGNKATDWTPAPEDQAADILASGVEYIEGTQTEVTNLWTGVTKESALVTGKTISYRLPYAGTSTAATLNLTLADGTTTGAKNIRQIYTTSSNTGALATVTTHWPVGSIIPMTYDGTQWIVQNYNTNVNQVDRVIHSNALMSASENATGKSYAVVASTIIGYISSLTGYQTIMGGSVVDISKPLLWGTGNVKTSTTFTNSYEVYLSCTLRNNKASWSGTIYETAYLFGTLNGQNLTVNTNVFTSTKPSTDDGNVYIPVGILYSAYQIAFRSSSDMYAYIDGKFQRVTPADIVSTHRIYYRTQTANLSLAAPTSWVSEATNNVYNAWTTKVPPLAASTASGQTKYLYLYTCEQRKRIDGTIICTAVQLDENTTIIDGGQIITNSITANQIAAGTITATEIDATDLHVSAANIDGTLTIGKVDGLQTALEGKQASGDYATNAQAQGYATTVQTNLDNLEIGGKNLLRNTRTPVAANYAMTRSTVTDGIVTITPTTSAAYAKQKVGYLDYDDYGTGTYTVSCDVRLSSAETTYTNKDFRICCGYSLASRTGNAFSSSYDRYGIKIISDDDLTYNWKRVSVTFDIPTDLTVGKTDALVSGSCLSVQVYVAASSIPVEARFIKLERGAKPTDWTPAPEDAEADISEVQTLASTTSSNLTTEINQRKATYGTCDTAAATAAKAVTCSNFALYVGAQITVRFKYGNTAAQPTLSVNGTTATAVEVMNNSQPTSSMVKWPAYSNCTFTYDGTYWRFTGSDYDQTTATNYITADDTGISIHMSGNNTTYQRQTATGTTFYVNDKKRSAVGADGLHVYVESTETEIASFTADGARIGKSSGESHLELDYHSMKMIDKEGTVYLHVSDLRGPDGIAEVIDRFRGDGTESSFDLTNIAIDTNYTVVVSDSSGGTVDKRVNRVIFSEPPTDGTPITVTYQSNNAYLKAYTFGIRGYGSIGPLSVSEGYATAASGNSAHSEGVGTSASGLSSHAEGNYSESSGSCSHAEGLQNTASGSSAHAEGQGSAASGKSSHAEGYHATASGYASHAEGQGSAASGTASHSEGGYTTSSGYTSHAEGYHVTASGNYSHAEGGYTTSSGYTSHAEGYHVTASGNYSHAEGGYATSSGSYSHAQNSNTIASEYAQTAIGKYNDNQSTSAFEIGNGTADNARSNAFTVDWSGNVIAAGTMTASMQTGTMTLNTTNCTLNTDYCKAWHNGVVATVQLGIFTLNNALANGNSVAVGTVPSGYRPAGRIYANVGCALAGVTGLLVAYIGSDGTVSLVNRSGSSLSTSVGIVITATYCI